ncbi:shikimate dehydrogenase [Sneathiella chinensis]|uniref:Shikimate dehydrogenase (NADP(+)) n=1 Tax=Sneathiella chinensis TaxID=349750 RepID=A0ABQ5TYM2_9PROT|nr:shikimate dehydrogenase [Sneathiella chinensis]GLQ04935.1 shikimate dehydrogenase (NADP(+)) [Sneathiella chinensis]
MKKIANVMGSPISHSLSPRLHGYWIRKYGLDADYVAREVTPEVLEQTLRSLKGEYAREDILFRGTNLTIPLKETALDIVDILDPAAKAIGAVNTVVLDEEGRLIGRNTDGIGFRDSLADHVDIDRFQGGTALVLGAGGASRAIIHACLEMGISRLFLSNRTLQRAEEIAAEYDGAVVPLPWEARASALETVDLLVNTTSLGMTGQPELDMPLDGLKAGAVVTDIVYVPLETALLKQARLKGYKTVDGLGMLLHQAKAGFEAWFGVKPDVDDDLRQFVLEGLGKK